MKRTLLFALTVAMSAVLFAAVPTAQTQVREINPTIRIVENSDVDYNAPVLTSFAKKATNATVTDLSTYYVPQSFNSGTPSRGMAYVGLAQIVVPYADSVAYVDGYEIGGTWTVDGEVVATDAPYYIAEAGQLGGEWELPVLKTNDAQLDDTTTVTFSEYQFGAYFTSKYAQYGFYNSLLMAPSYLQSMTKCAMYTEVQADANGDTYGSDWTFVTSSATGGYWYGTKMYDPRVTDSLVYFNEMMVLVDNAATMYIDHVSLGVYTAASNKQIFNSEDDHVKLTLYPTSKDAEGKIVIDYENPYATAVATVDDYVPVQEGSFYGILNFYFEEKNALGIMSEVPAIVEGTFAAVLSEYNEGTADFGIITDYYTPYPGDTYLSYGDKKWMPLWKTPGNLLMNFYAIFPTVLDIPAEVKVALEGETVELTLPSNVWYEDMEIDADADEWITEDGESLVEIVVEEGEEYEDFKYQITLTLDVEAADAPRKGVVEINALGKIYTINVLQGDVQSGVENVEATTAGKTFNLLGVEVDENYKGIVIKNGQKYIQ